MTSFVISHRLRCQPNPGKVLRARISLHGTWDTFGASRISGRYRLIVTGSTKHIGKTDMRGDHQIKL